MQALLYTIEWKRSQFSRQHTRPKVLISQLALSSTFLAVCEYIKLCDYDGLSCAAVFITLYNVIPNVMLGFEAPIPKLSLHARSR